MRPTVFTSENQPVRRRGKLFKTLLLDALRENSLIGLDGSESAEDAERAFIKEVAVRALGTDANSSMLLKELVGRSYPALKPVMQCVEFDFDKAGSVSEQVGQIIEAASNNQIPPDVANLFVQTIKAAIDIEASVDLKARIEALELLLNDRA